MTVKEIKEVFDHLERFLSIIEKSDLNAEKSLQVNRAGVMDTSC
jgi:hypothetical protein